MADRVVIDASLVGGLTVEQREAQEAEALELLRAGKTEEAQAIITRLGEAYDAGAEVTVVPLSEAELAQHETDQAEGTAAAEAAASLVANETTMQKAVHDQIDKLVTAAERVASGNATATQQRDALVLSLQTTARLARLVLRELDQSV